jgi:type II secretory pathway pseudopilin PulG
MLWESLIGIVVFSVLVLFAAPEWWSSSMGALKEKERKEAEAARRAEANKRAEERPKSEG